MEKKQQRFADETWFKIITLIQEGKADEAFDELVVALKAAPDYF